MYPMFTNTLRLVSVHIKGCMVQVQEIKFIVFHLVLHTFWCHTLWYHGSSLQGPRENSINTDEATLGRQNIIIIIRRVVYKNMFLSKENGGIFGIGNM